jgi:radical SAM superfamily enzyme YgiQ (UPF0313 family)
MAKVILISLPWIHLFGGYNNVAKAGVFYPPLGLCYLAASLKQRGHTVLVIDAEAQRLTHKGIIEKMKRFGPDMAGITAVSPLIDDAENLAEAIKSAFPLPVILGGPHVTIEKEKALSAGSSFDVGIIGEGEKTVCEIAQAVEDKSDFTHIKGIIFRGPQGLINTGPRPREMNLDAIPFPDRTVIDTHKYLWSVPGKGIVPLATILTSRGCPYRCVFCSQDKMYGNDARFRTPSNVADEIECIVRETPARHIIFCDDALTVKRGHIEGICDEIIRRKLKVTFEGWTRADTINAETVSRMKTAGLVRLSFGIESGDPDILRLIRKGETLEEIRKAYAIVKSFPGIETRGSVIIGLPGETKETVWRTIQFVRRLKELEHLYLNVAMPYPGTDLREMSLRSEYGMRLLSQDYNALRRYDNALIEVNDLKRDDLIRLQSIGLLLFYMVPSRIWHNVTRAGMRAGILNGMAFFFSFSKVIFKNARSAISGYFRTNMIKIK